MLTNERLISYQQQHSWLSVEMLADSWLVGNPDLDGLLCLALLRTLYPAVRIAGFYTGDQLVLTPEAMSALRLQGQTGFCAIEADYYVMPSVGQHLTLAGSNYPHLNPNLLRGFDRPDHMRRKYPLNTLAFLWRWFGLGLPSGQERQSFLQALFYPDGVLLKVIPRYQDNCRDWIEWLQLGFEFSELEALAVDDTTRQMARCIYKQFGNTQVSLNFKHNSAGLELANLTSTLKWVNWFCARLGLAALSVPASYVSVRTYVQHRLKQPKQFFDQLNDTRTELDGQQIVSDALVRSREWSVTLRLANPAIAQIRGLPIGLTSEPMSWIGELDLDQACGFRMGPCILCDAVLR